MMSSRALVSLAATAAMFCLAAAQSVPPRPVRVLVITGGHEFDRQGFAELWDSLEGLSVREVAHPHAHEWLRPDRAKSYDVLVCYDMHQEITEEAKRDFTTTVKNGKGLVVLHHALANYQDWEEWEKLAGGRFRTRETVVNGQRKPASTWKDDVSFRVRVVNRRHPVTQGMEDFDIVDETYGGLEVLPDVTPLLTTDEPTSSRVIAWAHLYGRGRVVAIQSGHGPTAWRNTAFRRMLLQAIRWTSRR